MLSVIFNKAGVAPVLCASGGNKRLMKPSELDIYNEPEEYASITCPTPSPAFLYENISAGRKRVTGVFSGLLTTHEKVSNTITTTEGKIKSTYHQTIADPYYLLTPGAIMLATAGGAIVAGRGRKPIQRTLYALLFGVTAASVSKPQRAMDIAATSYYHTASSISQIVNSFSRKPAKTTTERLTKEMVEVKTDEIVEVVLESSAETVAEPVQVAVFEEEIEPTISNVSTETVAADTASESETLQAELKTEAAENIIVAEAPSVVESVPQEEDQPIISNIDAEAEDVTTTVQSETTETESNINVNESVVVVKDVPSQEVASPENTAETVVVNTDEIPVVKTEETPVINMDETPVVITDETPVLNTDETPVVNTDETPVVNTDEVPIVNTVNILTEEQPYSTTQTELKEVENREIEVTGTETDVAAVEESSLETTTMEIIETVETDVKDVTREIEFDNKTTEIEGDIGQSNPEDADMYSTRS